MRAFILTLILGLLLCFHQSAAMTTINLIKDASIENYKPIYEE